MARWPAGQAICLHVLVALAVVPCAVAQSTCRVELIGTGTRLTAPIATANAVQSGSIRCTGSIVSLTGPIALRGLVTFVGAMTSLRRWSASYRPCLRQNDNFGACLTRLFCCYALHRRHLHSRSFSTRPADV